MKSPELVLKSSRPPSKALILARLALDAKETLAVAHIVDSKYPAHNRGALVKSSVPVSKEGKVLAAIRDDVGRIRVILQALRYA